MFMKYFKSLKNVQHVQLYNKCKQKYFNIQNIILVVLYYLMSEANLRVGSVSLLVFVKIYIFINVSSLFIIFQMKVLIDWNFSYLHQSVGEGHPCTKL